MRFHHVIGVLFTLVSLVSASSSTLQSQLESLSLLDSTISRISQHLSYSDSYGITSCAVKLMEIANTMEQHLSGPFGVLPRLLETSQSDKGPFGVLPRLIEEQASSSDKGPGGLLPRLIESESAKGPGGLLPRLLETSTNQQQHQRDQDPGSKLLETSQQQQHTLDTDIQLLRSFIQQQAPDSFGITACAVKLAQLGEQLMSHTKSQQHQETNLLQAQSKITRLSQRIKSPDSVGITSCAVKLIQLKEKVQAQEQHHH